MPVVKPMNPKKTVVPTNRLDYSMQTIRKNTSNTQQYHSFLLRIWRDDETIPWRIQIEDSHTNEVIGFHSVAMFKQFLDEQFSAKGDENIEIT